MRAGYRTLPRSLTAVLVLVHAGLAQGLLSELPRLAHPKSPAGVGALSVVMADVDGDGRLDVIVGGAGPSVGFDRLLLNDGTGGLTDVSATHLPKDMGVATGGLGIADFDKDGDLDILFGVNGWWVSKDCRYYTNDGKGRYTDESTKRLPAGFMRQTVEDLVVGDFDRDGDQDVVIGNFIGQTLVFWENDGTGRFADTTATKKRFPPTYYSGTDLSHGDIDADQDLDLVFGTSSGARVYINNGQGYFTEETLTRLTPPTPATYASVALGDVDGDGDLDLVVPIEGAQPILFVNDGRGFFNDVTRSRMPKDALVSLAVETVDLDLDGDRDIVITGGLRDQRGDNRVYGNDGRGAFKDVTATAWQIHTPASFWEFTFGDLDADGDPDLVTAAINGDAQNRAYFNLTRQLYPPQPPRLGAPYPIALWGPPGSVGLMFAAGGGGRLAVPPYGTFLLDPGTTTLLPGAVPLGPAGQGTYPAVIPNDPRLRTTPLRTQALLLDLTSPLASRLTGAFGETIQ